MFHFFKSKNNLQGRIELEFFCKQIVKYHLKVVRSARIRGIVHPAAIRLLGQIVSGQIVKEPLTVFIPLTSGRTKLMLLQSTELLDDIYLFTLTALEDKNSSILNGILSLTLIIQ